MKKIRIIYTIPNFDTCGSGLALLKLVLGLNKDIFDVTIVCLHDKGTLFQAVKQSGIRIILFEYLSPLKPRMKFLYNLITITRFFINQKPDIIFSYHYSSDYSEAIAARLAGAKFMYVKKNMGWEGPSFRQWKVKTFLANAITVQNTDMMKTFFKDASNAFLIPIGVDTNEYRPREYDKILAQELGLKSHEKIVVCVANIIPKKGIDYLLKGFSKLSVLNQYKLLIVGDRTSELGAQMHALMYDLGLENHVLFTGKRFDVPRFYSLADIFILPSTGNEGAPIAIQEAMASGVLVVTTDTPGNRDQLRELPDHLFQPSDAQAIADALHHFLHISKEEKLRRVEQQHKIIADRYSLTEEIRKHEELYRNLVKRS